MKRIIVMLAALAVCMGVYAQSERFEQRYDLLVSQFGPAGVGVQTVLDNWAKVDSTDAKMLLGRFSYYYAKAQSTQVVKKSENRYLGMEPVLSLKDSTGADVHYFQVTVFDDALYAEAVKAADKAIAVWPDRIDFRFMKANAYIAYEKESPDMAFAYLSSLIDENSGRSKPWSYEGEEKDEDFFQDAMQEYCYSFFRIATPASYEAFYALSSKLASRYPDNMSFLNNMGSYHLVARNDYKNAYKCYDKVLKMHPDDNTAIMNGMLAARKQKNVKKEKKYLELMVRYGSEKDSRLAKGRLEGLNMK
ncbi:MAG: hypothetical protein IJB06_04900 [Bacteroidales bacterium]|nr:hypothetical protein [Bacteroidales bacterium]